MEDGDPRAQEERDPRVNEELRLGGRGARGGLGRGGADSDRDRDRLIEFAINGALEMAAISASISSTILSRDCLDRDIGLAWMFVG